MPPVYSLCDSSVFDSRFEHFSSFFLSFTDMPDTRKGSLKTNECDEIFRVKETLEEGLKNIEKNFQSLKEQLSNDIKEIIKYSVRESIAAEVKSLHQTINDQREEIDKLKHTVMQLEMDRLKEKRREIACNLILRGVDEENEKTEDQTKEKVTRLLKRAVPNCNVVKAVRIGKFNPRNPKIIKVTVDNFSEKISLLKECRKLRDGVFHNIFVSPDRTPLDRMEDFRLRQKFKKLRTENPNSHIQLRGGRLLMDDVVIDHEEPLRHLFPTD